MLRTLGFAGVLVAIGISSLVGQADTAGVIFNQSKYTFYQGQTVSVAPLVIGLPAGQPLNCFMDQNIPGLQLDAATCKLTGIVLSMPVSDPALGQVYNVHIQSSLSSWPIGLTFVILPPQVTFSSSLYNFYVGQTVNIKPQVVGYQAGQIPGCFFMQFVPGLQIDPTTCVITGTVGPLSPDTAGLGEIFHVSLAVSGMSQPIQLSFKFLPRQVVYPATSYLFKAGQAVSITPRFVGPTADLPPTCFLDQNVPGLQINPVTCAITGTLFPNPPGTPSTGQIYFVNVQVPAWQQTVPMTIRVD